MTPNELRAARGRLKLSQSQLGKLLGVTEVHIRRMETPAHRKSNRAIPPYVVRLVNLYLDGYRPNDWPVAGKYGSTRYGFPRNRPEEV